MNYTEWTDRTDMVPTDEQWEIIQTVYNFSPAIGEVTGKDDIAALYRIGGMPVIQGLFDDALAIMNDRAAITALKIRMEVLEGQIAATAQKYNR